MNISRDRLLELLEQELLSLKKSGVAHVHANISHLTYLPSHSIMLPTDTSHHLPAASEHSSGITLPEGSKQEKFKCLHDIILNDPVCQQNLHPGKKLVIGKGNLDADIFFCGEAPGADEETLGEPFVGRTGQLLTKIIMAMGLSRDDVYIGNIMNWRPDTGKTSGNRPPTADEMRHCLPYLLAQLSIVSPKVIVALGATAVAGLLGADPTRKMRDVRGKWHDFNGIPLMVTFHPSYLLRNATNATKRLVWEDMLAVMEKLSIPISDKQRQYFLN